jgi:hypothetical protein
VEEKILRILKWALWPEHQNVATMKKESHVDAVSVRGKVALGLGCRPNPNILRHIHTIAVTVVAAVALAFKGTRQRLSRL